MKYFEKAANCLNACDTPVYLGGGGYPIGTIFVCCATYTGTGTPHPLHIIL